MEMKFGIIVGLHVMCLNILILKKGVPVECYYYIIAYLKTILYPIVCKNSGPHLNLYKVCADAWLCMFKDILPSSG